MKKLTVLILLFSTLVAAIFRLYRLTEIPTGLLQDEVIAAYDAYAIGITGKDHHGVFLPIIFQSFNDWTMPVLTYLLVPFMKFGDLSAFWVRFPIALISTLTIPLYFWFSYRLFSSKEIALLTAFFGTISSFAITTGRWSIPPNTVVFFFLLGANLLLEAVYRKERPQIWLLAGSFILGLSMYTYPSLKVFLPVYLLVFWLTYFPKVWYKPSIWVLFLPLLIVLPLYYLNLTNFSLYNNRFAMVSIFSHAGAWPITYVANYFSYLLPGGLFLPGDVNPTRSLPGFGYEHLVYGVFYYWGVWQLLRQRIDKRPARFLLGYLLISPLGPALTVPGSDFQRAIYMLPLVLTLTAFGFKELIQTIGHLLHTKAYKVKFVFFLLITVNFFKFWFTYTGDGYKALNQWYYQDGLEKVFRQLRDQEANYKTIIVDSTINSPYAYYLFYNKIDPRTLDYLAFTHVGPNGWLNVERIGNYRFSKIEENEIKDADFISEIPHSPWSVYRIYKKNDRIYLFFAQTSQFLYPTTLQLPKF